MREQKKREKWASLQEYVRIVDENFDELWAKAVKKNQSEKGPEPKNKAPDTKLRTVSVTLDKVLRKDFSEEAKATIKQLLVTKQAKMSSHVDEIQSAIAMAQLVVVQGQFHPNQDACNEFDICDILPETFVIRDDGLRDSHSIRVLLRYCGEDMKRTTYEKDSVALFSDDCIQYIATRLVRDVPERAAPNKKQKQSNDDHDRDDDEDLDPNDSDVEKPDEEDDDDNVEAGSSSLAGSSFSTGIKRPAIVNNPPKSLNHPLWNKLAFIVREEWAGDAGYVTNATSPKGLSLTRTELIGTIATNYKNIWKPKMYLDLKRAVVRCLLRIHLRPLGEERYRDRKKKYAAKKVSKAAEKLKSPYVRRKAHRWTIKKLLVQLDEAISSCTATWDGKTLNMRDRPILQGQQSRIARVKNIIKMLRVVSNKIEVDNRDIENMDRVVDDSDDFDMLELAQEEDDFDFLAENDAPDEDDLVAAAAEDAHDDADSEQVKDATDVLTPEPSAKHLRGLEAVTCLLLDTADCPPQVTPDIVRGHLFEAEKFNGAEINVVADIVNKLRPYTPKRDEDDKIHGHVLIMGPFCLLANSLLRSMGYSDFTRRLFPLSSCGKSHPIPLSPISTCEVLCSAEPGHFDVKKGGMVVSNVRQARKNERAILGAFFDLEAIFGICRQHHLLFEDRLQYVDPWTVQILGSKIKVDTVEDVWSEKKKKHILPSASSKHPTCQQDLIQSGISAEMAEERAREVEETLKGKIRTLQQLNRMVTKQGNQQRLLSIGLQEKLALRKTATAPMDADYGTLDHMDLDESAGRMDMGVDYSENNPEPTTEECIQRAYKELDDQRNLVQQTRASILPFKLEIKNLKEEKYAYNKFSRDKRSASMPSTSRPNTKGKRKSAATAQSSLATSTSSAGVTASQSSSSGSAKSPYTSTPSGARPGSMDYVEATCIKELRKDIEENNRVNVRKITLVPGGTDPGAKTLFETVVVSEATLIKLQNRFQLLSEDAGDSPDDAIADQTDFEQALEVSRKEALAKIKIPDTFKTTVRRIRHLSGLNRHTRHRKQALEKNQHIGSVYTELGKTSPYLARTITELKTATTDRREAREQVHAFEHSNSMARNSRNTKRRLKRTYDHVASKERQAFKKTGQGKPSAPTLKTVSSAIFNARTLSRSHRHHYYHHYHHHRQQHHPFRTLRFIPMVSAPRVKPTTDQS
ncbi:hypothetical protein BGZ83_011783 [Gryganskiella cystojenkinii]|nr:hypothetical protein BGZ83_011783 [Gryganskiella cystojenkinii]